MENVKFSVWENYVRFGVFNNLADARALAIKLNNESAENVKKGIWAQGRTYCIMRGTKKSPLEKSAFATYAPVV